MNKIYPLTTTLTSHQDAVERFLALYDLYRHLEQERLNVSQATEILQIIQHAAETDRDLNIRAWANYYYNRIMGQVPAYPRPFLPRMWQLLIVE